MSTNAFRTWTILIWALVCGIGIARADFTKTIYDSPGTQVQAVATFYFASCTQSLGVGSYSVNVAPQHGSLSFSTVSGPVPGCPAGSPSLPAAAAFYTMSSIAAKGTADYFQLYFSLNGQVAEVIDVTVDPEILAIMPTTLQSTTSGDPYSVQFTASGAQGPVTWSLSGGSLPLGFSLSPQGVLSSTGNPAAVPGPSLAMSGPYSFTVEAQDSVTTATQALTLSVLTPDCSQKVAISTDAIDVTTNPTLRADAYLGGLHLGTQAGIFGIPFSDGIDIYAGNTIYTKPGANVYETPKDVYINNMYEWSGFATYGETPEYAARLANSVTTNQPVSFPLLDLPNASGFTLVNNIFPWYDSPNVNLPLLDADGTPLTRLSYTKRFTTYIGCMFDSDLIFHTLAAVNWSAYYSGTVEVPKAFGHAIEDLVRFTQTGGAAVLADAPQTSSQSPVMALPLANCHTKYQNFDGTIQPATCAP